MAQFGNSKQTEASTDIFHVQPAKKQVMETEAIIPGQRPAPWLGAHMLSFLSLSFVVLLTGLLVFKFTN